MPLAPQPRPETLVLCAALTGLFPEAALAEDGPGEDPVPVVMLASAEGGEECEAIVTAARGHLSDLDVAFVREVIPAMPETLGAQLEHARRAAEASGALAVFWSDETPTGDRLLYISEPGADRILVRKLEGATDDARAEELGVIVRASVVEMLGGGTIGVRVVEVLRARGLVMAPAPAGPPTEPTGDEQEGEGGPERRLYNTLVYSVLVHSDRHPAVQGLGIGLGVRLTSNWSLTLGYTILSTIEDSGDLVTVRLDRHPITLGVSARFQVGQVWIGASVGGLLDYATFENYTLAPGMLSVTDRADFIVSAVAGLEIEIPIAQMLYIYLRLGAEVSMVSRYYAVEGPDGRRVLIDSWPVQPWGLIGFLVEIL